MISIAINEETETIDEMVQVLQEIANKIQAGYTSGMSPAFVVEGEEENKN